MTATPSKRRIASHRQVPDKPEGREGPVPSAPQVSVKLREVCTFPSYWATRRSGSGQHRFRQTLNQTEAPTRKLAGKPPTTSTP